MLVGPTGGGKTKIFRTLRMALDKTTGITHKDSRFNPKAIRAQEMYGEVDPATGEWNTGKDPFSVVQGRRLVWKPSDNRFVAYRITTIACMFLGQERGR